MVDNKIFFDFGMGLGRDHVRFLGFNLLNIRFFPGLFPSHFLSSSDSKYRCLGLSYQGSRMESIAKVDL